MNTHPDHSGSDARFDEAVRRTHAVAVDRLSPRVRAQLAQRRNAALRGEAVAPARVGLRYAAAGFAALCALAIGLQFGSMPAPASLDPGIASTSAPASLDPGIASTSATPDTTMLDEDPEFYAWLASADAQQIAME